MLNNYIIFHCHTMDSNATTTMDSITSYKQYIDKAKNVGMKMIGFSEHGNTLEWYNKKKYCESAGLRYIHGIEAYVTESFGEKIRDNYHIVLMARNFAGVLELNTLISKSFNRSNIKTIDDVERMYYNPRISADELINTSENIIITTACLGGILNSDNLAFKSKITNFLIQNKSRCFLEIQHHNVEEQIAYNKELCELSKDSGIKLIAGTDTHSLDDIHVRGRTILQQSKKIYFDNEKDFDLTFKTYDELINCYKTQDSISEEYYIEAIHNTNLLYDMIDDFQIDCNIKYPSFSNSPEDEIWKIIKSSDRYAEDDEKIFQRVNLEMEAYRANNAFNFLLLEYDVKKYARENNIHYGDSRGSVSGSYVAYILRITNSNSIKHGYNFERFMNKDRVSIADIDTDFGANNRDLIKEYLHNNPKYYTSEIVTFNTIADKGAIRDVGRAFNIPLEEINEICRNFEDEKELAKNKKNYQELFKWVDILKGTIVSIGSHPAATICSPISLHDNIGTITLSKNEYPVSCLNMKEIDSLNFTKLDILGLDNVQIIYDTCKLAGIEVLTSDNIDDEDENVWKDIMKDPVGIFQMEGDYAHGYLKSLFQQNILSKIKSKVPNMSNINLMSLANGAIRPAGESYRESLANGDFKDNGNENLNQLLQNTLGWLVYQEQIIDFLHYFCQFSKSDADLCRRSFAKKLGDTEKYIPEIKAGFSRHMKQTFNIDKKQSEEIITSFIQVIIDASNYLFSYNHAQPYSYIGYIQGYLRYYYEIEFLTVLLNINKTNQDKTKRIFGYIKKYTTIKVYPIKFRYSRAEYFFDKKTNSIYNGIEAIKDMNYKVGEELYGIRDLKFQAFVDLLVYIIENLSLDKTKIEALIKLNFFIEFGNNKKLFQAYKEFKESKFKYVKKNTQKTKDKKINALREIESGIPDEKFSIKEQISYEIKLMNNPVTKFGDKIEKNIGYVTEINLNYSPKLMIYGLSSGKLSEMKISKKIYDKKPVDSGDIIQIVRHKWKNAKKKVDGKWKEILGKRDCWIEEYIIRKDFD